jgi:hypothetical protein
MQIKFDRDGVAVCYLFIPSAYTLEHETPGTTIFFKPAKNKSSQRAHHPSFPTLQERARSIDQQNEEEEASAARGVREIASSLVRNLARTAQVRIPSSLSLPLQFSWALVGGWVNEVCKSGISKAKHLNRSQFKYGTSLNLLGLEWLWWQVITCKCLHNGNNHRKPN